MDVLSPRVKNFDKISVSQRRPDDKSGLFFVSGLHQGCSVGSWLGVVLASDPSRRALFFQ
jgi:hypothetical protein